MNFKGASVILLFSGVPDVDVIVAPPAPYLTYVKDHLKNSVKVSAQNCYKVCIYLFGEIMKVFSSKYSGLFWRFDVTML